MTDFYGSNCDDYVCCVLHSNDGPEVEFTVWLNEADGEYHVFAETHDETENFLETDYPEKLEEYRTMVAAIPTAHSKHLSLINSFVASHTYNSIRPVYVDEYGWLALDEGELMRD